MELTLRLLLCDACGMEFSSETPAPGADLDGTAGAVPDVVLVGGSSSEFHAPGGSLAARRKGPRLKRRPAKGGGTVSCI